MLVGRKVLTARGPRPCPECARPILPGDEVVREVVRGYEDERLSTCWLCLSCSALQDLENYETLECPLELREDARERAHSWGWRRMLEGLRRARARVRRGLA
jgi:hypothetical protein